MRTMKRQAAMFTAMLMMALAFSVMFAPAALAAQTVTMASWGENVSCDTETSAFTLTIKGPVPATLTNLAASLGTVSGNNTDTITLSNIPANHVGAISVSYDVELVGSTIPNCVTIVTVRPVLNVSNQSGAISYDTSAGGYIADFYVNKLFTSPNITTVGQIKVTNSSISVSTGTGNLAGYDGSTWIGFPPYTSTMYSRIRVIASSTSATGTARVTATLTVNGVESTPKEVTITINNTSSFSAKAVTLEADMGGGAYTIFSRSRDVSGTTSTNPTIKILSGLSPNYGKVKYGSSDAMWNYPYGISYMNSFTYTPVSDWAGEITFDYEIADGSNTASNTVTIKVRPKAVADSYNVSVNTTYETTSSSQYLLHNDTYPAYDATVTIKSNPSSGTLTLLDAGLGSFRYVPNVGFNGRDTFTYIITSNGVESATATVTLKVGATSDFTTPVDQGLSVTSSNGLLAGYGSGYSITTNAYTTSYFTLYSDGSFTFVPPSGQSGIFPLNYNLVNNNTSPATTTAMVQNIAVRPRGINSTYDAASSSTFTLSSSQASTANLGSNLRATVTGNPSYGSLNMLTDGTFTYVPNSSFVGTDTFRYKLTDTVANLESDEITVTMRVASSSLLPDEPAPTLPPTGTSESINWALYCLGAAVLLGGLYAIFVARRRLSKK